MIIKRVLLKHRSLRLCQATSQALCRHQTLRLADGRLPKALQRLLHHLPKALKVAHVDDLAGVGPVDPSREKLLEHRPNMSRNRLKTKGFRPRKHLNDLQVALEIPPKRCVSLESLISHLSRYKTESRGSSNPVSSLLQTTKILENIQKPPVFLDISRLFDPSWRCDMPLEGKHRSIALPPHPPLVHLMSMSAPISRLSDCVSPCLRS